MAQLPLLTFAVYTWSHSANQGRGAWVFHSNCRGKTAKQLANSFWWVRNRDGRPIDRKNILVIPPHHKPKQPNAQPNTETSHENPDHSRRP